MEKLTKTKKKQHDKELFQQKSTAQKKMHWQISKISNFTKTKKLVASRFTGRHFVDSTTIGSILGSTLFCFDSGSARVES